jgi:hypothetical protein
MAPKAISEPPVSQDVLLSIRKLRAEDLKKVAARLQVPYVTKAACLELCLNHPAFKNAELMARLPADEAGARGVVEAAYASWVTEAMKAREILKARTKPAATPAGPVADKTARTEVLLASMLDELQGAGQGVFPPSKKARVEGGNPAVVVEAAASPVAANNLMTLADMLTDPSIHGSHKVWDVMKETYGTPARILLGRELQIFFGCRAGVLRGPVRAALDAAFGALSKGTRESFEKLNYDAFAETAEGNLEMVDHDHLFEGVEKMMHAVLREQMEEYASEPTFRDPAVSRKMEILKKYWPRPSAPDGHHSHDADSGSHGRGRGGRGLRGRGGGGRGARTPVCFRCGEGDHKVGACKIPREQKCEKCGKPGHIKKACYQK